MKQTVYLLAILAMLLTTQCTSKPESFTIKFDSSYEVSGHKFAIRDIHPDLPRNWDEYNFVVLEFRITTAQRFQVGFTTDYGYNELRVMSYLPNAWNKLTIPLKFFRQLPDARVSLAATYNQPRNTGWICLGGKRGELHGVDSIGIRMRVPIGSPEFEIRSINLTVEDPGDEYLGEIPIVDEFGQHNLVDYPEKIRSLEQLQAEWEAEDKDLESTPDYNFSRYGGFLQKQVKGNGYFRIEKIDERWWFVDPDGYLFLSHGVDCVNPGAGGIVNYIDKREGWLKELPPEQFIRRNNRNNVSANFGTWNLYRRFGENYRDKANNMIIKRMERWGLNTLANWTTPTVYGMNRKAFILQLRRDSGLAVENSLMGLADVYTPGYIARLDSALKTYLPANKDNPWLIGYFVGNEPSWLRHEARLCDLILEGEDRPIKTELQKFLQGSNSPERKKEFIYKTFRIFLNAVKTTIKQNDPNHLNLGFRFGNLDELDEEILDICCEYFDVLSFNCYFVKPSKEMMDRALRLTDMPMIIGEYHFGTVDRGMAQSLWQVNSELERSVAYRYYTEQAYAHPGMIGTGYFQWGDEELMGRSSDGENYNCGLVDVTDRPYKFQVEAIKETAKRLYSVHSGKIPPYDRMPDNARGHDMVPDFWNTVKVWKGYDWKMSW